jgi:hypothetical protein
MPHRQSILLATGRVLVVMALCALAACRGERSRAAQLDTTTGRSGVGVAHEPSRIDDPALVAATAALDSLAKSFARARASLDSEALALRDANRLDTAYIARYASFEHRRAAAADLRAARDHARRTRDSLATHPPRPSAQKH